MGEEHHELSSASPIPSTSTAPAPAVVAFEAPGLRPKRYRLALLPSRSVCGLGEIVCTAKTPADAAAAALRCDECCAEFDGLDCDSASVGNKPACVKKHELRVSILANRESKSAQQQKISERRTMSGKQQVRQHASNHESTRKLELQTETELSNPASQANCRVELTGV